MKNDVITVRTGNSPAELKENILAHLYFSQAMSEDLATLNDWYMAVAYTVRDRLMKNWVKVLDQLRDDKLKIVSYLSAEFLMGPHLGNALINLDIYDEVKTAVESLGLDFEKILAQEEEPGLGNGGLGRLAACFMDSLTTLQIAAIGYGIRYEFGIFDQRIENGCQVEVSDNWLLLGNPWEIARPELSYMIKIGGTANSYYDEAGNFVPNWVPAYEVKGVAHDTPVPGYKNNVVNLLRLWKSEAVESFDFSAFNKGDYYGAVDEKILSETISKVLYPNDEPEKGKRLRLIQQYFFVSCSLQDMIRVHLIRGLALERLHEHFAIQMNDTHPTIAVAELMRLLVDEHHMDWDKAWAITKQCLNYTNHTLLPEALEKWSLPLFASILPRHLQIIYEINGRFLELVKQKFPGDDAMLSRMSVIDESGSRYVRMANLACIGSAAVNGVSALHSELLKQDVLSDFYAFAPEMFMNVTNGVTPRRWVKLYNPQLAKLISSAIGDDWITSLETSLVKLEPFAEDASFREKWHAIKLHNKQQLAALIKERTGIDVNPASLFDIQVKRFHEYKRQHLNLLHIVHLYNQLKSNPSAAVIPRTFIFGGKAAPGYMLAKLMIRLINAVADTVNNDPVVAGRIKVVFFPDFNVKNSEHIYKAAELSEQISTAGKEASGTGNMKFSLNGALTIGTYDGANVEIFESVGKENFFLFGLTTNEVQQVKQDGYQPFHIYQTNNDIRQAVDLILSGVFSNGDTQLFRPITDSLLGNDPYLVLKDFASYAACQQAVSTAYADQEHWTRMSILNVARTGGFSSDRSIREYCEKIWHVKPVTL